MNAIGRPPVRNSPEPVSDVTLQINVCAGDLAYADVTVPALIAAHRADVADVLIVADACRPQSTPVVHSPSRFPAPAFGVRIAALRRMCERWLAEKIVDRIEWIEPAAKQIAVLNRRYLGHDTDWTHDHLGHALTAYFAGWDCPRTRYVLHFDADVLLHQAPSFRWLETAIGALARSPRALAASPRIAPPDPDDDAPLFDSRIPGNGWQSGWPLIRSAHGWSSPWFSTRCHLLDRARLAEQLPLSSPAGPRSDAVSAWVNRCLFPLYNFKQWIRNPAGAPSGLADRILSRIARRVVPPFPLPPEVLLHATALRRNLECIYLGDPRVWYIHPDTKPPELVALLPQIVKRVTAGAVPAGQYGFTGIRCSDWSSVAIG